MRCNQFLSQDQFSYKMAAGIPGLFRPAGFHIFLYSEGVIPSYFLKKRLKL